MRKRNAYLFLVSALCLLSAPASADLVTNTFTGTIVPADNLGDVTVDDVNFYFGGGSLLGNSFTLTTTVDTSALSLGSFFTGSSDYGSFYYYPPNPMTATLTINGYTFSFDPSSSFYILNSDGNTAAGPGPAGETFMQDFFASGIPQIQGFYLDLTPNVVTTGEFTTMLPPMLAGNGDFTLNGASFYDAYGESLTLGIDAVNATPEPAAWTLLLAALCMLGYVIQRRNKPSSTLAAAG